MRNFIGRKSQLQTLEQRWPHTALLALYGRRRVGKTELLRRFAQGKTTWHFEAIEGETTHQQVRHFLYQLSQFTNEPYLKDLSYHDWPPALDLLSEKIAQQKELFLVFDELSWMAADRTKLVSYIKYYWDQKWKQHPQLLFILCGSVASWMVKHVVKSNALYGRLSESILLEPLQPFEVAEFIGQKRGQKETLEYLLLFGGIPRYLEEFDFRHSLQLNIEKTCFQSSGFFFEEADKIFYNQFKETHTYHRIVRTLLKGSLTLQHIAKKMKRPSSGGFKLYLDNLIAAGIIKKIHQIKEFKLTKTDRYYVSDEFLRFHTQFIAPHHHEIKDTSHHISFEKITRNTWHNFLGLSFERFCIKHRYLIAELLGFSAKVTACGPLIHKGAEGYQYDLIFLRHDGVITVCEIKYLSEAANTKLIQEMETKLKKTTFPKEATVERVLICNQEPTKGLRESGYFHSIISAYDLIQAKH